MSRASDQMLGSRIGANVIDLVMMLAISMVLITTRGELSVTADDAAVSASGMTFVWLGVMFRISKRRQRLGDLVAETDVVRTRSVGFRALGAVSLIIALATGCTVPISSKRSSDATGAMYQAHGIAFRYPAEWQELATEYEMDPQDDDSWTVLFGRNETDLVTIHSQRMERSVTADNLNELKPEITADIQAMFRIDGATVLEGPQWTTVAGRPALRYRVETSVVDLPAESISVNVFDGPRQFVVACRYSTTGADEIQRGCARILDTFTVEGTAR